MRHFVEDAALVLPSLSQQFYRIAIRKFHVHFGQASVDSAKQFSDFLTTEDSTDE